VENPHEHDVGRSGALSREGTVDDAVGAGVQETFDVHVEHPSTVLYALAYNRTPLVHQLTIVSRGVPVSGLLHVDLAVRWAREGRAPAKPVRLVIDPPQISGDHVVIEDVDLKLDETVMVDLEEAVPATLVVTLSTENGRISEHEYELRILARNQWARIPGYEELLASYVQPNHPATKDILRRASRILKDRTGSSSLEGYQSGHERTLEIGRAIYEALQETGLSYINPPASFEIAQKIRPLDEVLEGQAGTCIDLACAYASCLEQAGLKPIVWLVPGHAFAGFLTEDMSLERSVEYDANVVLNLTDAEIAFAIETVGLTDGSTFEQAHADVRKRLSPEVEALIDVHRAHLAGNLPLPARVVRDGVVTVVVDPGPGAAPVVERRDVKTGRRVEGSVPTRVSRWKASLLDLTFRNPLLKFSTARDGLDLLIPPAYLNQVEDDLILGKSLKVVPSDVLEGPQKAMGLRTIQDATRSVLEEYYQKLGVLYTTSGLEEAKKRTRKLVSKARIVESETGANNLFLILGTLVWRRKDKPQDEVTSPLFLVPVRIHHARGNALFTVALDETGNVTPNYCLAEKLKADFGMEVLGDEQSADDEVGLDIVGHLATLRRELAHRGLGFRVEETAHLAVLNFSSFRLWKDMDEHWESFLQNDVVRHMVETPGAPYVSRQGPSADLEPQEDPLELSTLCPVPADGSQLRAIARALAGESFVLEGPPGTGKSQTITNLLASALAKGKTVLFVAEKDAALSVVKDRLSAVGLDPFCLNLHNKGSKPEEIREQLRTALEHAPTFDAQRYEDSSRTLATLHKRLDHYRQAIHEENALALSFASAYEQRLALGEGPAADVPFSALSLGQEVLDRLITGLQDAEITISAARPNRRHPWRFVDATDFAGLDRPSLAEGIEELSAARAATLDTTPTVARLLSVVRGLDDLLGLADTASLFSRLQWPSEATLEAAAQPDWAEKARSVIDDLAKQVDAVQTFERRHGAKIMAAELAAMADDLADVEAASKSFFLVRRKRTRQALQALLKIADLPKYSTQECLSVGAEAVRLRHSLEEKRAACEAVLSEAPREGFALEESETYSGLRSWVEDVAKAAALLKQPGDLGDTARELAANRGELTPQAARDLRRFAKAVRDLLARLPVDAQDLAHWLDERHLLEAIDAALPRWSEDARDHRFLGLQRWLSLRASLEPLLEAGVRDFVESILDGNVPAEEAYGAFRRGLLNLAMRERAEAHGLDVFDRFQHERAITRYMEYTSARQDLLKEVIPGMLSSSRTFNVAAPYGEVAELRIELNKKRRTKSIRQLLQTYPRLIQQLTPCFLMSPSSVAQFVPPGTMRFDLVVFDEASQIDVAEAIGSMGRADAVVIVGDSKQMPPSRTFDARLDGGESFDSAESEDDLPEDGESLLTEAVDMGMHREWLDWHYRSRDESLIAFSNFHYYDKRLYTFPSPLEGKGRALSWRRVNGQFGHGSHRTNPVEAKAVVDEVIRRVNDPAHSGESIGIVTLNKPQQEEIEKRLEECDDLKVVELFRSEGDDSILVRNLENVQGQERDVIILSTSFSAKADGGPMPLNFGPLNRKGGERRLNVAITRARRELLVISSFDPEDIDEDRAKSQGLQHLKAFLKAARDGVPPSEPAESERERLERYRDDVERALEERGLEVRKDYGLSRFRVDLAARPAGTEEWRAAILLDGQRWSSRSTVLDRDALPLTVLRQRMGWPVVLRVWLPSWVAEREALADAIAETVKAAPSPEAEGSRALPAPGQEEAFDDPVGADLGAAGPVPATDELAAPDRCSHEPSVPTPAYMSRATTTPPVAQPEFEPYVEQSQVGSPEECSTTYVSRRVKAVVDDVIAKEGPVSAKRLARLVASRFGIQKLHSSRADAILSTVPRHQLRRGRLGVFAWPDDVDPASYAEFRPSAAGLRAIEDVAPEELANAMNHIAREAMSIDLDTLVRQTAILFGVRRVSSAIYTSLQLAVELAVESGRLVVDGSRYAAGDFVSRRGGVVR